MLNFTVFADSHYKKGMYATTVKDLKTVFKRAEDNSSQFVVHCGDLCNNYIGSKEFTNAFLNNEQGLKCYGLYGNHELEGLNNNMQIVTPLLTNDKNVIWGTKDKKIGDGSEPYYYFDKNNYRLIFTDTNYSLNPATNEYEHNPSPSYGPKEGNININALGPKQLKWLKSIILDAAEKSLKCIVFSHAALNEKFALPCWNSKEIKKIFDNINNKFPKTVIMQISGHSHSDRAEKIDGIIYWSVNTTINGIWKPQKTNHYSDDTLRFDLEKYDENGNLIEIQDIPVNKLIMSPHTYFFADPLSANVLIEDNKIIIEGTKTTWRFGINPAPEELPPYCSTEIKYRKFEI